MDAAASEIGDRAALAPGRREVRRFCLTIIDREFFYAAYEHTPFVVIFNQARPVASRVTTRSCVPISTHAVDIRPPSHSPFLVLRADNWRHIRQGSTGAGIGVSDGVWFCLGSQRLWSV